MSFEVAQFAGEQLRLARVARGFSLETVGEMVGASRQYIQQLETGAKKPSEHMIYALAERLGVMASFFFSHCSSVKPEQCHFRKQMTTPLSLTSQVLARGTLIDRLASELDVVLRLPKVNFPDFQISSDAEIERVAEECRKYWGLGISGPITSMMRVVENAGAIVTCFEGISDKVDALSMDRQRPLIVRNLAKGTLCRLRFDLAHEAGHLVMHRGLITGDSETEGQANRFAGAFLLPKAAFAAEFVRGTRLNWDNIFAIKRRWKVAARAIVRRAFDLGFINHSQYRIANIHLVKTGQSKLERYDDQMPLERPELLEKAFEKLEQTNCGLLAFSKRLHMLPEMFEHLTGHKIASYPANVTFLTPRT